MAAVMRDSLPPIDAVEDMIAHDIKVLEPLINSFIKEAEERGRLLALKESTT